MVSAHDSQLDNQRQLVPTRALSISSRTTAATARRDRKPASRRGSSSSGVNSRNEFPYFALTGDVEITLVTPNGRKEKRYLLHRLILTQASGYFEDQLHGSRANGIHPDDILQPRPIHPRHGLINEPPLDAKAIGAIARNPAADPNRKHCCLSLDWSAACGSKIPLLIRRPPSYAADLAPPPVPKNKPPASSGSFFRTMTNLSALKIDPAPLNAKPEPGEDVLRDYDNLFRVVYNHAPDLDSSHVADAYTECKALLNLAEAYDALDVVGPRVDHHMLRFGTRLFKEIARYPISYLKLGSMSHSKVVYSEALIHVVGQWPRIRPRVEGRFDPLVLSIIEEKVEDLNDMKAKVENKLLRLTLTTSRGDPVSPSTSFTDWLALSFFRQWITERITAPSHEQIQKAQPRGSGRSQPMSSTTRSSTRASEIDSFYRNLGSSSASTYLTRDDLRQFLKTAPDGLYTRDNMRRLERRLDEIKGIAREIVKPLMRNELEMNPAGLGYLTCTRVTEDDYPWEN